MTLDNYLQDLGKQESLEEKQIAVKKNPKVEELYSILKNGTDFLHPGEMFEDSEGFHRWNYEILSDLLEDKEFTSKDIADFSIQLKEYEGFGKFNGYLMGIFFSVLINKCEEQNFTLHLKHLNTEIYSLGFSNRKNITVFGDVYNAGECMYEGSIVIN
ncbi:hypothetical protein HY837_06140, partial [archaeon]|nr:hypothetical protein [archaeon]